MYRLRGRTIALSVIINYLQQVTGKCNICGWRGEFLHAGLKREGMLCGNCSSSSRHRMVMYALGTILRSESLPVFSWPADRSFRILESSARGSYPVMMADKFDYYQTEYDPKRVTEDPRAFADFQNLHYENETFDVVIASDVFEHIRRDEQAYREVYRVLKNNGAFVLTVPYDHGQARTIRRVDTNGEHDVHVLEPEYHGGGGHTLTYRNYGRDLLTMLTEAGFAVGYFEGEVASFGITHQSIIIGKKADYVDMRFPPAEVSTMQSVGLLLPYRLFLAFKYNMKGFVHYWKEILRK